MTLHECLGECAVKYGIGTPSYALACSKCYVKYPEERVPADPSKVSFWTTESWEKVSHDLLKYLLECGKCTGNCARIAEDAFMSTGWERSHKVSDVADTVYNIVKDKWTCNEEMAQLGKNWVNQNLNKQLLKYRIGEKEPEPIVPRPGVLAPIIVPVVHPDDPGGPIIKTVGEGKSCKGALTQCKGGLSCLNGICVKTEDVPPMKFPALPGFSGRDPDPEPGSGVVGECPRGAQYQAPIFGNCDPGYYREKSWGRDMCICEAGQFAATPWSKTANWITGNIKIVLIVMVIIVIGVVGMKLATKRVSIG